MHDNGRRISSTHPMVTLAIDEHCGRTYAKAQLRWGSSYLYGRGIAYRHPSDYLASETGQALATARALSDLADQVSALYQVNN
jgi:hypothetical protein